MTDTEITRKRTMFESVMYWRLAIAQCSGKCLIAGLLSLVQALNGTQWHKFNPTEKFICIVSAIGAMWMIVDAFLNTTMARLRAEQSQEKPLASPPPPVQSPDP